MSNFLVESWSWYGVTMVLVVARFISRLLHFRSIKRFQPEDWLMMFLACLYTILIVFLNIDLNVSTNLIDPAHPVDLTPQEIRERTWGSKTVILVEQCMCAVQWGCKFCLLLLYWRLTQNLKQNMVVKCAVSYVVITYVVMVILYFGVWCRPFSDYWETPTDNVQCTTALNHLITNLVFNLTSDFIIMSIPLPLLIKAKLEFKRKLLLIFPFSLGFFTVICAILSKRLSFTNPYSAEWVYWYCRESSTAMIVTNMPYAWALIRRVFKLKSFFGNSSDDRIRAGEVEQVQGHSLRDFGHTSQTRDRQHSHTASHTGSGKHGRWRWQKSANPKSPSLGSDAPIVEEGRSSRVGAHSIDKEAQIEAGAASGSNSSTDGSVRKPPMVKINDGAAVDKLYRLDFDDDDFERSEAVGRGYNG